MKNNESNKTQLPADEFDAVMEQLENPPPATDKMKEIIELSTEDSWTIERKTNQ